MPNKIEQDGPSLASTLAAGITGRCPACGHGRMFSGYLTLAPRYLGLRLMLAKTFARIHSQNLPNAGVLALTFANADDYQRIDAGDVLIVRNLRTAVQRGNEIRVEIEGKASVTALHRMSPRQVEIFLAGGLINWMRAHRTRTRSRTAA